MKPRVRHIVAVVVLLFTFIALRSTYLNGWAPIYLLPVGFEPDKSLMLSQGGQDRLLWDQIFSKNPNYKTGFFVEFGARDGLGEANSYFYEKQLEWRGLLLEAIPGEQKEIARSRSRAVAIDGGICEKDSKIQFAATSVGGWSGRRDSYDVHRNTTTPFQSVDVACFSLATLLDLFGIQHVNYLSVDTEGSELQALMGFPFDSVTVDVIGVEILTGTPERSMKEKMIYDYMTDYDFEILVEHQFAGDTKDTFFVPIDKKRAKRNDYKKFEEMKLICQKLQRCLI